VRKCRFSRVVSRRVEAGKPTTRRYARRGCPPKFGDAWVVLENIDRDAHAGMRAIVHIVAAVGVDNVDVIGIAPRNWPRFNKSPGVAAIVEAAMIVVATVDVETMLAAEVRCVVCVRNAVAV